MFEVFSEWTKAVKIEKNSKILWVLIFWSFIFIIIWHKIRKKICLKWEGKKEIFNLNIYICFHILVIIIQEYLTTTNDWLTDKKWKLVPVSIFQFWFCIVSVRFRIFYYNFVFGRFCNYYSIEFNSNQKRFKNRNNEILIWIISTHLFIG